jgi:hypothetical protein
MTDANAKQVRAQLNKSRAPGLKGEERANSNTCRVLSDALRDAGEERLADLWRAVAEFLDVWAEHRRLCHGHRDALTYASDRTKFIGLDYTDAGYTGGSGMFLVEKETGYVWSIRGYGKKNRIVALHLDALAGAYRDNIQRAKLIGQT